MIEQKDMLFNNHHTSTRKIRSEDEDEWAENR